MAADDPALAALDETRRILTETFRAVGIEPAVPLAGAVTTRLAAAGWTVAPAQDALRRAAGEAVLTWMETTHGNTIGEHDHHCFAGRWVNGEQEPTGEPCTCGWAVAEAALAALEAR